MLAWFLVIFLDLKHNQMPELHFFPRASERLELQAAPSIRLEFP
jgi:hypothetical protein